MEKITSTVGDLLSPAIDQSKGCLAASASQSVNFPCDALPAIPPIAKIQAASKRLTGLANAATAGSCHQKIWFSFFFDGTGNNLDADLHMTKHSNVAKLFRAHSGDENIGGKAPPRTGKTADTYRIYVPGVGTYFKEIKDPGGSTTGLGMGSMGDARIIWALNYLKILLKPHLELAHDPKCKITEINIAAFGFSRGSALARAFVSDLVNDHCKNRGKEYFYDGIRLRVRFLGIFDTVASSGLAASANVMGKIRAIYADHKKHVEKRLSDRRETRADILAFTGEGKAGADPTPGWFDGHNAYGGRLQIPHMVEDVRHIVAAHENRNSFPLDSVTVLQDDGTFFKPPHFHEYVFPGVHSDVGGSYSPGEGGKHPDRVRKLGLIPLRMMYEFALSAEVPMIPSSAWDFKISEDFVTDDQVEKDFTYYQSKLGATGGTLGGTFNAHMALLFQWRFQSIRKKLFKDTAQADRIKSNHDTVFEPNLAVRNAECLKRTKERAAAQAAYYKASNLYQGSTATFMVPRGVVVPNVAHMKKQKEIRAIEYQLAIDEYNVAFAKQNSAPNDTGLAANIAYYDHLFFENAKDINLAIYMPILNALNVNLFHLSSEARLRPHYRVFWNAYRMEFDLDRNRKKLYGMRDSRLITFFDDYVHDSLGAFAKDATFPSDPRVIYVGSDDKLEHA